TFYSCSTLSPSSYTFFRHLPHFSTHVLPFLLIFHSCPVILYTFYSCSTLFPSSSALSHSYSTLSPSSSTLFHSCSTLFTYIAHVHRHHPYFLLMFQTLPVIFHTFPLIFHTFPV